MGVESSTKTQSSTELASLQDTLDSEHVAFVDTLDAEIKAVIAQANRLQRYDYVVGEVDDYGVSSTNNIHFDIVRENEEKEKNNQFHYVIFERHRSSVTTDIENGMQVAVAGDVSFDPPRNRCSIEVDDVCSVEEDSAQRFYEMLPVRLWIALVAVLVLVLVLGGFLLLI